MKAQKRKRSLIQFFIVTFFFSFLTILFLLERDVLVHGYAQRTLTAVFEHSYKARLRSRVESFSLVSPKLVLRDVIVEPLDKNEHWQWSAANLSLSTSWLSFFTTGKFEIVAEVTGVEATSQHDNGSLGIVTHIACLAGGDTGYPAQLAWLSLDVLRFLCIHQMGTYSGALRAAVELGGDKATVNVAFDDGRLIRNKKVYFEGFSGQGHLLIQKSAPHFGYTGSVEGRCTVLMADPGQDLIFSGVLRNEVGTFCLSSPDGVQKIVLDALCYKNGVLHGQVEAKTDLHALKMFSGVPISPSLAGSVACNAKFSYKEALCAEGKFALYDVAHEQQQIGQLETTFVWDGSVAHGEVRCAFADASVFATHAHWIFSLHSQPQLQIYGYANGSQEAEQFDIHVYFDNRLHPCRVEYAKNGKKIGRFEYTPKDCIRLWIDYSCLHEYVKKYTGISLLGSGRVEMEGRVQDGTVVLAGGLTNGTVLIPSLYNCAHACTFELVVPCSLEKIEINNARFSFDRGMLLVKQAIVRMSGVKLRDFFVPCVVQRFFLNSGKQLVASVSGYLVLAGNDSQKSLTGELLIDKSSLKQNLFSGDVQSHIIGTFAVRPDRAVDAIELDIGVRTNHPLEVKTSFLKTAVAAKLSIHGSLHAPSISGALSLMHGQLFFPYRPLQIVSGHLYFMPNKLHDPLLEFVARGKVRTYQITMRCQGSIQSPQVTFESTPPLTQEQIVTLLLAGSSEGVLSLIMPSLIMQQINKVIFGPEQSAHVLDTYFKSLLAPLRHIRFVPSFADQRARGGIRGAIEVDVNDQLRAVIQKNFSLSEDTKIEVEYAISDDVTMRAIKDERGDYGGEVEMRLKF